MGFESMRPEAGGDDMNEAMATIAAIEAQVQVMGANDVESSEFQQIRSQLTAGEITPKDAIARAEGVRDGKQDYH